MPKKNHTIYIYIYILHLYIVTNYSYLFLIKKTKHIFFNDTNNVTNIISKQNKKPTILFSHTHTHTHTHTTLILFMLLFEPP